MNIESDVSDWFKTTASDSRADAAGNQLQGRVTAVNQMCLSF